MAGAAVNNSINLEILLLYLAAIFWTLGYDIIYGLQDIKDDEIIGMKSTSIKFKEKSKIICKYLLLNKFYFYYFIFLKVLNLIYFQLM